MEQKKWVAGWSCCENVLAATMSEVVADTTFRYNIFASVEASAVRLRFSNLRGREAIRIDAVTVARGTDFAASTVDADTIVPVTFGGLPSVVIEPGDAVTSDGIPMLLHPGDTLTVSHYTKDVTELYCGHTQSAFGAPFMVRFLSRGDCTRDASFDRDREIACPAYVFLSDIDFLTDPDVEAIVAFGDSITAQPWPDYLVRRLYDLGIHNRTVLRKAIGGSRMLRDYTSRTRLHYGIPGVRRFEYDISRPGVTKVIVLHGINDIIHPGWGDDLDTFPTMEELLDGYRYYIDTAHQHGLKIYFGTLLPCTHASMALPKPSQETLAAVNDWIRSKDCHADGVIEFHDALMNPDDPLSMLPEYTADKLHPSLLGASLMASTVPIEYITD